MFINKSVLKSLSVIAVTAFAFPAFAESGNRTPDMPEVETKELKKDVKQGWEKTKETASETAQATEELIEGSIITIRQALVDRDSAVTGVYTVNYSPLHTAEGMIGSPVHNSAGDVVGSVEDILVNDNGKATHIIVENNDLMSINNKKVAFAFDQIAGTTYSGAVLAPITDELIRKSESYDPGNHQGTSLNNLLSGEIVNHDGKSMANIENVVIDDGYATYIVAGLDQFLGMGGEEVALAYSSGEKVPHDYSTNLTLNRFQSANFKEFKQSVTD